MEYLRAADPRLARILRPQPMRTRRQGDVYVDLLESILSQQLSGKAASTIISRFLDLFPHRYPTPARLRRMSPATLRAAGVSRQKAGYLRNVAIFAARHGLDRRRLARLSDVEIIDQLTQIKGVGHWTAEMLLMFSLNRPDVFAADDLGLQTAMRQLYGLRGRGARFRKRLIAIAEKWRPYRTLVCKCLWQWRAT